MSTSTPRVGARSERAQPARDKNPPSAQKKPSKQVLDERAPHASTPSTCARQPVSPQEVHTIATARHARRQSARPSGRVGLAPAPPARPNSPTGGPAAAAAACRGAHTAQRRLSPGHKYLPPHLSNRPPRGAVRMGPQPRRLTFALASAASPRTRVSNRRRRHTVVTRAGAVPRPFGLVTCSSADAFVTVVTFIE